MTSSLLENIRHPKIKVVGVGVTGVTVVNQIMRSNIQDVEFVKTDNDAKHLDTFIVPVSTEIEDMKIGFYALNASRLRHSKDMINKALGDSDMVFIVAGINYEGGIEASKIIAAMCRDEGAFTIAIVTWPFLEREKVEQAEEGIKHLLKITDTVFIIPKGRLKKLLPKQPGQADVYDRASQIVYHLIKGIYNLITLKGWCGIDVYDVKEILSRAGGAAMGFGQAKGENRVMKAIEMAVAHPLLEHVTIADAKRILFSFSANNPTIKEIAMGSDYFYNEVGHHKAMIWGAPFDASLGKYMQVMIIVTGIDVPCYIQGKKSEGFKPRGKVRDVTPDDLGKFPEYDKAR